MNPRILITGITGLRNRGVEALLATAVAGLRRHWPDCHIDVLTYDYPFDSQRGWDVDFRANLYRVPSGSRWRAWAQRWRPRRLREAREMSEFVSRASVVIASGGDVFSSDYGGLRRHLLPLHEALDRGIPVFFLGHSIGRFRQADDAEAWLACARRSLGVTVRESASYQYLTEELRLREVPVEQAADTAFLLEPASAERVAELRRSYGLDDDRECVACSVSQGIARYASHDQQRHVEVWKQLIDRITGDGRRQVVIIPHVQERIESNDDRVLAQKVLDALGRPPGVVAAAGDHSAAEYKGLVATCDFAIAERMHAAIAGLSSAVPTLTIGYSIKAEGIVADVLGSEAEVKQWLVPFPRFVETGQATALFDQGWQRRHEMAQRLAERLPEVKQDAEQNFTVLADLLAAKQLPA
jgi:colanic acid/amylovoran biosynthesis protein WcaK/AmsJ